jgi:hypothetical protein
MDKKEGRESRGSAPAEERVVGDGVAEDERSGRGGGTTFVEWSSSWSESEGGVAEFCNPIYQGLLAALQKRFG